MTLRQSKIRNPKSKIARGRPGFSFVEVLFAVMILGIGFILIAGVFPVAIAQTQSNGEETVGAAIGRNAVAYLSQVSITGDVTYAQANQNGWIPTQPWPGAMAADGRVHAIVPRSDWRSTATWGRRSGTAISFSGMTSRATWSSRTTRGSRGRRFTGGPDPPGPAQHHPDAGRLRAGHRDRLPQPGGGPLRPAHGRRAGEPSSTLIRSRSSSRPSSISTTIRTSRTRCLFSSSSGAQAAVAPGTFVVIANDTTTPPPGPNPPPPANGWVVRRRQSGASMPAATRSPTGGNCCRGTTSRTSRRGNPLLRRSFTSRPRRTCTSSDRPSTRRRTRTSAARRTCRSTRRSSS